MQLTSGKTQPSVCVGAEHFECWAFPQALQSDNETKLSDANSGATLCGVRIRSYLITNEPQAMNR